MKRTIINGLIAGLAAGTLAGCGGNTDSTSSSGSKLLATTTATPSGPAGFTNCAGENGTCSFFGTHEVAYGANGVYYYKTISGSTDCNNTVFGDPAPGAVKACFYQTSIAGGTAYRLVGVGSNLTLDVAGAGMADGTNVDIWANNGEGSNAQKWTANLNSDGTWTLINPHSGKALDDANAGTASGTNVQIATSNSSNAQRWRINANSDGSYTLINVNANMALDVVGNGTTAGTNVDLWPSNGGNNQKWFLVPFNTGSTPTPTPTPTPTGWTLGWSDEFNGTSLDTSKWNIEVNGTGFGNNELEYYTNRTQNVSVSGGNLVITARQENYTGPDGTRQYTSARINTQNKFSQTYGRMEARMKLPVGQGVWPAFWLLGNSINSVGWPKCGEIDTMEHVNTEAVVHGTIHWADVNGNHASYSVASGNVDVTQWHVYAVEWDTNAINWFVDGTRFMTANIQNNINNTGALHNPFFLVLNLAVGGDWAGSPNGSVAFPQQLLVDYVRVYHR